MLTGTNVVEGFVEPGHNVKAIQYIECMADALLNDEVWLPHIRADVFDESRSAISEYIEELHFINQRLRVKFGVARVPRQRYGPVQIHKLVPKRVANGHRYYANRERGISRNTLPGG